MAASPIDPGGPRVRLFKEGVDWNAQLPYFAPSSAHLFQGPETDPKKAYEKEHTELLKGIVEGLASAVEAGDWYGGRIPMDEKERVEPRIGVVGWIRRLKSYDDLKYPISMAQRVAMIRLFYSLLSLPVWRDPLPMASDPPQPTRSVPGPSIAEYNSRLDPSVLDSILSMLVRLFRKSERIEMAVEAGDIAPLDLDWKPLWRLWRGATRFRTRERMLSSETKPLANIMVLSSLVRPFLKDPSGTKKELLEEMLPYIDSELGISSGMALSALGVFTPSQFPPSDSAAFDHIPMVLALYLSAQASALPPSALLTLIARTAKDNIATPERIGITGTQIRAIVSAALGMGGIIDFQNSARRGVGGLLESLGGQLGDVFGKAKGESGKKLAELLVWTTFPEGGPETGVPRLIEEIVGALDTYFHPSNTGKWTVGLVRLLKDLLEGYLARWRDEQTPGSKTPEHLRLTPELLTRICAILRPPILLALYGKDGNAVQTSYAAIKLLCWLDPHGTFPPVLDRIHGSLEEGGTSVHRTTTAIALLSYIATPLLNRQHYPPGAQHLMPLLHAVLPGIDMNDPNKTRWTLLWIIGAVMSVPVVEAGTDAGGKPSWRREGSVVKGPGSPNGNGTSPALSDGSWVMPDVDEDDGVQGSTMAFADWVLGFLNRTSLMMENLPQGFGKGGGNSSEDQVMALLMPTVGFVINQASPEIRDLAIRKVAEYASSTCIPNATKPMGRLVGAVVGYEPAKALSVFLPLCRDKIKQELEHGASSHIVPPETDPPGSDAPLHWWQCIAYNVCQYRAGAELIKHRAILEELLELSIEGCKSDRGYRYAGKLLKRITKSLVDLFTLEAKTFSPEKWEDSAFMGRHFEHWGEGTDPNDIGIEWNIAGDAEKDYALALLEKWSARALEKLAAVKTRIDEGSQDSREASNEISKWLLILKNVLSGSQALRGDPAVAGSTRKRVTGGYCFSDPTDPRYSRAKDLRERIGQTLHDTAVFMQARREDDIEAFKVLTKVVAVFICDTSINPSRCDQMVRGYKWYKSIARTPEDHHRLPRWILILRVMAQHLTRLKFNNYNLPRTPLTTLLIEDLTELSLSRYSEVRVYAQSFLSVSLHVFPSMTYELAPRVLDVVEKVPEAGAALAEDDSDRFKGALHLLHMDRFRACCLADPDLQRRLFLALVRSQFAEKVSIRELVRTMFVDLNGRFSEGALVTISGAIAQDRLSEMVSLCGASPDANAISNARSQVKKFDLMKMDAYRNLTESLMDVFAAPTTHWRSRSMALTTLELVLRDDLPISLRLTELVVNGIVSEELSVRRTSVALASRLLFSMKRRAGVITGGSSVTLAVRKQTAVAAGSGKEQTEAYIASSLEPPTADTLFSDKPNTGWFCWPASYRTYSPGPGLGGALPWRDPTSTEALDIFLRTFSDSAFWEKHVAYQSQEASGREGLPDIMMELFDAQATKLYKSLFAMFEDRFLDSIVRPILERLCGLAGEKSKQRAAAEIAGGLVRGMKHWSLEKQENTWSWLAPLAIKTMMGCGPEALGYWNMFIMSAFRNRDPRRVLPLARGFLDLKLDPNSESFFHETKKVQLVLNLFGGYNWRLRAVALPTLDALVGNIRNPYEKVRDTIGVAINAVLQSTWVPSMASASEVAQAFATRGDGGTCGIYPDEADPEVLSRIEVVLADLARWRKEGEVQRAANVTAVTDYGSAGKTVATWVSESLVGGRLQGTLPYIHRGLLQEMLAMSDFPEPELAKRAQGVLGSYTSLPQTSRTLPAALAILTDVLKSADSSWHLRQTALPVLQTVFFRHLFSLDPKVADSVMDTIAGMLSDPQIEVRQRAAKTLAGLVRCSQRESIDQLKNRFGLVLRKTKLPARVKATQPTAEYNDALLKRHSAVLGLTSLVSSFPYEVPEWMPGVLTTLAACLDDPAPIQGTVKAVFADFRRTHQDSWHEDKLVFAPEELELLSGALVGANYYV